jgi:aryl-alcohol dehydrogenase-like predicted oxidoreductase
MQYRRLGEAGIKLSEIGLGGWLTFGNALEQEDARVVMAQAFESGINFFDTADAYAKGKCEEAWGVLLKERKRSDYVLATKVFFPTGEGANDGGLSRKHVFESCHQSMRRLKTDYIDIYQCHRFDPETPVEETVGVMDDLVRQGKILYWGFSEWKPDQIEKCLRVCGDRYERPRSSQPQYNLVHRNAEASVMPLCQKAGIGQVVFSPLAQGVLTGKYKPGQRPPADSRAADFRQNQFIKPFMENERLLRRIQRLIPLAQENNCSVSQLVLCWVLRRPEVTSCIVGASKSRQLAENAEASGKKLSEETLRKMEEIVS